VIKKERKSVSVKAWADLADWLDGKVKEGIWRNRTHALERLIQLGQKWEEMEKI